MRDWACKSDRNRNHSGGHGNVLKLLRHMVTISLTLDQQAFTYCLRQLLSGCDLQGNIPMVLKSTSIWRQDEKDAWTTCGEGCAWYCNWFVYMNTHFHKRCQDCWQVRWTIVTKMPKEAITNCIDLFITSAATETVTKSGDVTPGVLCVGAVIALPVLLDLTASQQADSTPNYWFVAKFLFQTFLFCFRLEGVFKDNPSNMYGYLNLSRNACPCVLPSVSSLQ